MDMTNSEDEMEHCTIRYSSRHCKQADHYTGQFMKQTLVPLTLAMLEVHVKATNAIHGDLRIPVREKHSLHLSSKVFEGLMTHIAHQLSLTETRRHFLSSFPLPLSPSYLPPSLLQVVSEEHKM